MSAHCRETNLSGPATIEGITEGHGIGKSWTGRDGDMRTEHLRRRNFQVLESRASNRKQLGPDHASKNYWTALNAPHP